MSDKTKISWTNATWNPVHGCSKVSDGCTHCYAETLSLRYGFTKKAWGIQNAAENVTMHPERLNQPLKWKEPRRVFVNSMSDLFHELVPFEFVNQVFGVMQDAPQHTFQILTKRPARMLEFFRLHTYRFVLPNVWLGVSVENQKTADERIPLLLQTPAAVRFLSCEPLLGAIDLEATIWNYASSHNKTDWTLTNALDWVIVGGESGKGFRVMNLDWARSIRDQCAGAGVPFFFKQSSSYRSEQGTLLDGVEWHQFPQVAA